MHLEVAKRAGLPVAPEYDHRDRNPLNNTRGNLRPATHSLNSANKSKPLGTSSDFKGVHWDKNRGKWLVKIKVNRKTINLGRYTDEIEAAAVYAAFAIFYFGEFACL